MCEPCPVVSVGSTMSINCCARHAFHSYSLSWTCHVCDLGSGVRYVVNTKSSVIIFVSGIGEINELFERWGEMHWSA